MKITVFTPAFNRGYIIEQLYRSLQRQSYQNFEWLVIDDGSTDHTKELFDQWIMEKNSFTIRYYRVENGGKHRAINRATDLAQGELFFIVDSDDYLTDDALQCLITWENTIERKEWFCGVSGNKGRDKNELIGTTFDGDFIDATSLERNQCNITGDKAEAFYTHILKRYKFDEIEGEKFMTEATVWDRMAYDGYKIRWFNETIYICDYLEDGLTNNIETIFANNPKGTACYIKQQIRFYRQNLKGRMSHYNLYYDFVKSKVGLSTAAKYLDIHPSTLILAIFLVRFKKTLLRS